MSDLRKAAEMALGALEGSPELLVDWLDKLREVREALRQALAQPEQEQCVTKVVAMHEDGTYTTERIPLPKREWVGLTEEEFFDLLSSKTRYNDVEIHLIADVIRATQAKLKEKNT